MLRSSNVNVARKAAYAQYLDPMLQSSGHQKFHLMSDYGLFLLHNHRSLVYSVWAWRLALGAICRLAFGDTVC